MKKMRKIQIIHLEEILTFQFKQEELDLRKIKLKKGFNLNQIKNKNMMNNYKKSKINMKIKFKALDQILLEELKILTKNSVEKRG